MPIFFTVATGALLAFWMWKIGGAMIKAREWPDLAVSTVLLVIAYAYAVTYIWGLPPFFPSDALGKIIMPLIEAVYGNWL